MQLDLSGYEFYIRPNYTDMRIGAQGLTRIVRCQMNLDPYSKCVFLFCGKNRKTIKAIVWDRNGWITISKKLISGLSFKWPLTSAEALRIDFDQILGMLKGYDMWREFPVYKPELV